MDLNLLPQDLRSKEEKEKQKIKKLPHDLEVELYNPAKINPAAISGSDKPKPSWWQSLFGLKSVKNAPAAVRLAAPLEPAIPQKKVIGNEWVKKYPAKMPKPAATVQPRSSFWQNLFGKPALPIISGAPEVIRQQPLAKSSATFGLPSNGDAGKKIELSPGKTFGTGKLAKEPKVKAAKTQKPVGDSWLSIFSNLFSFGRRDVSGLHFAGAGSEAEKPQAPAKPETKPEDSDSKEEKLSKVKIMEQTKPSLPEKKSSAAPAKEAEKHQAKKGKTAYHLVPKFEKGNGINVNLMPGDLAGKTKKTISETRFLAVAIILPMILITAAYGSLWLLQQQANKDLAARKTKLEGLQGQISVLKAKEKANNDFANRLTAVKKLNDEKAVWSNFFNQLERYTLDGVYFTNLTVDTSGVFVLPGIAADYETLAKQLALFKTADNFIKDFTITNTELYSEEKAGVVGVSFQLRLTLQEKLLTLK